MTLFKRISVYRHPGQPSYFAYKGSNNIWWLYSIGRTVIVLWRKQ